MTTGEENVVTLDAGKAAELGLSEADAKLLTETGLPSTAGMVFGTDLSDWTFGLFDSVPLNEDGRALWLGTTGPDGDMLYFLDVAQGLVVLFSPGDEGEEPEEPEFEVVNSSLGNFAEFVRRIGSYMDSPESDDPADDRAQLAELTAELEERDPDAFEHPHSWWAMVTSRLRRDVARRSRARAHGPAQSQSEAFDRALDRLAEGSWQLVTAKQFAAKTGAFGLLSLPEDFSDAFSADGALLRDVEINLRGGLLEELQSIFAREGLVIHVPEEPEPEDDDFDAAMQRLLAAEHGPQVPEESTVTCLATTEPSDLCRILRAFEALAAKGYVAEPALWPTTSGCWERVAELTEDVENVRAVFWNTQSHDSAFDPRGDLRDELYLGWSGDREEIAEVLTRAGLPLTVPEDDSTTFIFTPTATAP